MTTSATIQPKQTFRSIVFLGITLTLSACSESNSGSEESSLTGVQSPESELVVATEDEASSINNVNDASGESDPTAPTSDITIADNAVNETTTNNTSVNPDQPPEPISTETASDTQNSTTEVFTDDGAGNAENVEFENTVVEEPETSNPAFRLNDVATELINSLLGYQSDQLALVIDAMAHEIIDSSIDSGLALADEEIVVNAGGNLGDSTIVIERTQYNCIGGGSVIREIGRLRVFGRVEDIDGYDFNECVFSSTAGPIAPGDYHVNGNLIINYWNRSGSRLSNTTTIYDWTHFQLDGGNVSYEVHGSTSLNSFRSVGGSSLTRSAQFDQYRKYEGEQVIEEIVDSMFEVIHSNHPQNNWRRIELELSGSVAGTLAGSNAVQITNVIPFSHRTMSSNPNLTTDYVEPLTGMVDFSSSEGSNLSMSANNSGSSFAPHENLFVDWTGMTADGESFAADAVWLGAFSINAPNCTHNRPVIDGPVMCDDGGQFMIP